jgi:hypothetical protein
MHSRAFYKMLIPKVRSQDGKLPIDPPQFQKSLEMPL